MTFSTIAIIFENWKQVFQASFHFMLKLIFMKSLKLKNKMGKRLSSILDNDQIVSQKHFSEHPLVIVLRQGFVYFLN